MASRVLTHAPGGRRLRYGPVLVEYCAVPCKPSPIICFEYSTLHDSARSKSKRGPPASLAPGGLGRGAGRACSRGSSKCVRSLALDDQQKVLGYFAASGAAREGPTAGQEDLTGGEEEAERRGPHVSHLLVLCYRVPALGIVRFLNKMHHPFVTSLQESIGDFSVDGCSAEAKILGPTFARNEPGLPNQ